MPDNEFTPPLPLDFDLSEIEQDDHELEGADGPCFEDHDEFEVPIVPLRSVSQEDRDAYIRLSLVNGIGPRMLAALVDYFGSATDVLKASQSQLSKVKRIGPKLSTLIRDASRSDLHERVYEHCLAHSVQIIVPGDHDFPRLLSEIADPPLLLFVRGSFEKRDAISIGMVGTRHCTHYGRTMAERFAKGLAMRGITVISGLARGIDGVCHESTLSVGGRTIAVLGSSVTDIYPPEHEELADRIAQTGALISETHPFAKPKAGVFPQRNRIISGLSLGVLVVEAADRSGSLITARHAGEQGREVFAIPGPVTSRMSKGCHQLIRDGATLVCDAEEILEHLGPLVEGVDVCEGVQIKHPAELQLNEMEQRVLQSIASEPMDIDAVVQSSGLPIPRVLSTISVLEMRGLIKRPSGRSVCRI
ncbi:MAG: DNA-processing protein DprA [Pirellula sp.]|jgi:DNA processing protein|nr:DNA-processing protein DprA [Pirellula sp.]